jgi:hypothetical protein
MGIVMGVLYWKLGIDAQSTVDRVALMFFSMIFLMLSAVLPTILTVLPDLEVLGREHRNNWHSLRAFYLAKLLTDTPLLVLPPLIYLEIDGTMSDIIGNSAPRFVMIFLGSLVRAYVFVCACVC